MGFAHPFTVSVRCADGSLRQVGAFTERGEAERALARVREDIDRDEPWIFAVINTSAGQLRG